MFSWPDGDVWTLVCSMAAAVMGWWLRSQRDAVPPELAEALRLLLERQKKKKTEGLLAELFEEAKKG